MKKTLTLILLLAGTSAFAARPTIGHQKFPDDYKPSPCAPSAACASLTKSQIAGVGAVMRGYSIKQEWVDAHWDELLQLMRPTCAKLATCYATPGNQSIWCTDLLFPEFWGLCDRYPEGSEDREQCAMFMRTYTLRADLQDKEVAQAAQECAAKTPRTHEGTMKVSFAPQEIGEDYKGTFTVYALDEETKIPIQALVSMNTDARLSARSPGGKPWTNYEIRWKAQHIRVPNAAGHTDLKAPQITISKDGYAPITMTLPFPVPQVAVEMKPAVDKLKPGKNTVTFTARDVDTGKPVELRILLGDTVLGNTNEPLQLELKAGQKRPEIWATSLFNRYSDVVIAPAEK